VPTSLLRSKRAVAVAVAATLVSVSAAVLLSGQTTTAVAATAPGSTVRASVGNGTPPAESPDGGGSPELSADGTAIVFTSYAQLDDLKTGGNQNIYVRDLRDNRTVLISRGQFTRPVTPPPTGGSGPHLAGGPLLSLNGAQPTVTYGETMATGPSYQPTISGDGRYVAFVTQADNIVPEDADTDQDLLVVDRDPDGDGTFDEEREGGGLDFRYFRVSEPRYAGGESYYRVDFPSRPKLSDDASRIVWEDQFVDDEGNYTDVVLTAVLRSPGGVTRAAAAATGSVQLVRTPLGESQPTAQYQPDVSSDGQFVVLAADYVRTEWEGEGSSYIPFHAVVRKDMTSGAVLRVDWDEAVGPDLPPEEVPYLSADESVDVSSPAISGNGGEIAFMAEEFENHCSDGSCWYSARQQPSVYVVRIDADAKPVDSVIVSRDNAGEFVNGIRPALSGDGRFVAFATDNFGVHDGVDVASAEGEDNCVVDNSDLRGGKPMVNLSGLPPASDARDRRTACQVVVRDLVVDRERRQAEEPRLPGTLASPGGSKDCAEDLPEGGTCAGNDDSPPFRGGTPSLSRNGSTIGYDSRASDLVPDDKNERPDVFVRTFKPDLRPDPNPLNFGELTLGDTFDEVVAFDHVGLGPLVVTDVVIEGSDEFALGAQTCSGEAITLQQADTCEVSVTFAPAEAGDREGTLRLTLRDGRQFTVPLRGKGVKEVVPPPDGPRFAAGPDPLNFGDRLLLSDGPTQTVTVTNTGGSPLKVGAVTVLSGVAPTDYTFTANTCTGASVPPKGTCQVTVKFAAGGSGDRPAVLRFVDDAPGGQAHLIGLTGKGSTPTLTVTPAVTPPGRAVTVTGQGYAPGKPVTITITGSIETVTAVPDATGLFTQPLLILLKSTIGNRPVVGTIDGTGLKAERPLLIVAPTVTPSDFVVRG
jgi:hypothetical protein